jgi:hypothetical protein
MLRMVKISIGPMMRAHATKYWSRFERWPEDLLLMLRGQPVPDQLVQEAKMLRVIEKKNQEIRDSRPSGLLPEEENDEDREREAGRVPSESR